MPRLHELDSSSLQFAAEAYEDYLDQRLMPACQAHRDRTRESIDEAVVMMLSLPDAALRMARRLRALWCREPSVHGYNGAALDLLKEAERVGEQTDLFSESTEP